MDISVLQDFVCAADADLFAIAEFLDFILGGKVVGPGAVVYGIKEFRATGCHPRRGGRGYGRSVSLSVITL